MAKENYYENYFLRQYNAAPETRRASLEHWEKLHKENKALKRFDLVIFSAEHIRAIKAAETISAYMDNALVFFEINTEKSLYSFDFFDAPRETFETYAAAAAFAEYNLNEMRKIDNENC